MLDDGSFMWTFTILRVYAFRVYAFFSFIANQTPDAQECKHPPSHQVRGKNKPWTVPWRTHTHAIEVRVKSMYENRGI